MAMAPEEDDLEARLNALMMDAPVKRNKSSKYNIEESKTSEKMQKVNTYKGPLDLQSVLANCTTSGFWDKES